MNILKKPYRIPLLSSKEHLSILKVITFPFPAKIFHQNKKFKIQAAQTFGSFLIDVTQLTSSNLGSKASSLAECYLNICSD
jgi:hypothetical protein